MAGSNGRVQHLPEQERHEFSAQGVAVRAKDTSVMARPGNKNGVKRVRLYAISKGHSSVNERVRNLARGVIEHLGLDETLDMPLVRAWAKAEILATECYRYVLDELDRGELSSRLLSEWRQTSALQLTLSKELGLTPSARVALGLSVAQGRNLSTSEQLMAAKLRKQQAQLTGTDARGKQAGGTHPPTRSVEAMSGESGSENEVSDDN